MFLALAAAVHFSSWFAVSLIAICLQNFTPAGRPFTPFLDAFVMTEVYQQTDVATTAGKS